MSRTYRRTKDKKLKRNKNLFWSQEWLGYGLGWLKNPPNSVKYQKDLVEYHSDHYSMAGGEPGPSWFRNLFANRPLRRDSKEELRKFMLDPDHEVIIPEKNKLPYWS